MQEHDLVEPDYLKGFNEGYTIAQHMPELAAQLADIKSDSARLNGLKAGRDQYQAEQVKHRLPEWLKGDRFTAARDTPSKSKDRDIEPER